MSNEYHLVAMVWVNSLKERLREIWKGVKAKPETSDFLVLEHREIFFEYLETENYQMTMHRSLRFCVDIAIIAPDFEQFLVFDKHIGIWVRTT